MRILTATALSLALFTTPAAAQSSDNLTPILMANGEDFMQCDGVMRRMFTTPLSNKEVVKSYLFANLVTDPGKGLDITLHSDTYDNAYPAPYPNGPSSQWGSLGELHIFSQPRGHTGGRQGAREMTFPGGIYVNDFVELTAICWGGGTAEIYAQIWVRDAD